MGTEWVYQLSVWPQLYLREHFKGNGTQVLDARIQSTAFRREHYRSEPRSVQ